MNPMMQMGGLLGRIVHHGSPHQWAPEPGFPRGRPRLDKIGTGEGAQAYGHGMYFAESPGVARAYQNTLSGESKLHMADGSTLDVADLPWGSPQNVAGSIWLKHPGIDNAMRALDDLDPRYLGAPRDVIETELKGLEKKGARLAGEMYSLDLPDERLPGLLDWDKPLSQQTIALQKAREIIGDNPEIQDVLPTMTGEDLYKRIFPMTGMGRGGPEIDFDAISQELNKRGIPGLRYLDAGSRNAGAGTSNFVIWDQALLDEMARRMQ
jgi:hypothetical protein